MRGRMRISADACIRNPHTSADWLEQPEHFFNNMRPWSLP